MPGRPFFLKPFSVDLEDDRALVLRIFRKPMLNQIIWALRVPSSTPRAIVFGAELYGARGGSLDNRDSPLVSVCFALASSAPWARAWQTGRVSS